MLTLFLQPGDLVCNAAGVPADSDHRQVLRSFINMIAWGMIASAIVVFALA